MARTPPNDGSTDHPEREGMGVSRGLQGGRPVQRAPLDNVKLEVAVDISTELIELKLEMSTLRLVKLLDRDGAKSLIAKLITAMEHRAVLKAQL